MLLYELRGYAWVLLDLKPGSSCVFVQHVPSVLVLLYVLVFKRLQGEAAYERVPAGGELGLLRRIINAVDKCVILLGCVRALCDPEPLTVTCNTSLVHRVIGADVVFCFDAGVFVVERLKLLLVGRDP